MANFPVFRGGQLTQGVALRNRNIEARQAKEAAATKEQAEALRKSIEALAKGREIAVQAFDKAVEVASNAAANGAAPDSNVIKQARVSAVAALSSVAGQEGRFRATAVEGGARPEEVEQLLPTQDTVNFVQTHLPRFDAAIGAGQQEFQTGQVETLSPEEVQGAGLPKDAVVQRDSSGALSMIFTPSEDESAIAERVRLLTPFVGEESAVGIATGRFGITVNPVTNEAFVLDKATGERIGDIGTQDPTGETTPLVPEEIETALATGASGALRNLGNIVLDAVGLGLQSPEAQTATDALNTVQKFTTLTLQKDVAGRPSVFTQQQLQELTVTPNSLLKGEQRSKSRLEQTRQVIDSEITRIENEVLTAEISPTVRVDTETHITRLKGLREAYDSLVEGFDSVEDVEPPPDDLPDAVKKEWAFMSEDERALFTTKDDD